MKDSTYYSRAKDFKLKLKVKLVINPLKPLVDAIDLIFIQAAIRTLGAVSLTPLL